VLGKADMAIAARYSVLAGDLHARFFGQIRDEFTLCIQQLLGVRNQQVLHQFNDTLRRSIRLRNPYVDPMNLLQIELLGRWRQGGHNDEALYQALVGSIHGISRALQDAG